MDPITIALALAQFIPEIIKFVTGNSKASTNAQKIVDIVQKVTGKSGLDNVEHLKTSPDAISQAKQAIMSEQSLEVDNEEQVNDTIQVQAKTREITWRDFIAFCFGFQAIMNYTTLPAFGIIMPQLPNSLLYIYGGVLGVAVGHSMVQLFKK